MALRPPVSARFALIGAVDDRERCLGLFDCYLPSVTMQRFVYRQLGGMALAYLYKNFCYSVTANPSRQVRRSLMAIDREGLQVFPGNSRFRRAWAGD